MTSTSFEREARAWLELGPTQVPVDAVEYVLAAVATIPQDRPSVGSPGWRRTTRHRLGQHRLVLAAAAAAVVVLALAAGFVLDRGPRPDVAATPGPVPSGVDGTGLLTGRPVGAIHLSRSNGDAGTPISSDETMATIDLGRLQISSRFVVGATCHGPGGMLVQVFQAGASSAFTLVPVQCDGRLVQIDSPDMPPGAPGAPYASGEPFVPGQDVRVTVAAGASWRVAIGEYLPAVTTRPTFAPVEGTPGWIRLADLLPYEVAAPLYLDLGLPDSTTRIGLLVECRGNGTASIGIGGPRTDVACPTAQPQRVELPVDGGEAVRIEALVEGLVWVRAIIEVDGSLGITRAPAPAMPPELADTPYAVADGQYLGLGTLGGSRQTVVQLGNAQIGMARGDLVPVMSGATSADSQVPTYTTTLDLWSIAEGRSVQNLATVEPPSSLFGAWLDPAHEQVFYAVITDDAPIAVHRVALDGSGDAVVLTLPPESNVVGSMLAPDDAFLLIETCAVDRACVRHVIDAATLGARSVPVDGPETCQLIGIVAADQVVAAVADACNAENVRMSVVASALDGRNAVPIRDPASEGLTGDGWLVRTATGTRYVYADFEPQAPDSETMHRRYRVHDLATGETTDLRLSSPELADRLEVQRIGLPDDWILLAGWLGDFPTTPTDDGPVPILINLVTGEQIGLVNLPH